MCLCRGWRHPSVPLHLTLMRPVHDMSTEPQTVTWFAQRAEAALKLCSIGIDFPCRILYQFDLIVFLCVSYYMRSIVHTCMHSHVHVHSRLSYMYMYMYVKYVLFSCRKSTSGQCFFSSRESSFSMWLFLWSFEQRRTQSSPAWTTSSCNWQSEAKLIPNYCASIVSEISN